MSTAPKIESSDLSIEQVYKDFYVVPDYQREYIWSTDDVQVTLLEKPLNAAVCNEGYVRKLAAYHGSKIMLTRAIGDPEIFGKSTSLQRALGLASGRSPTDSKMPSSNDTEWASAEIDARQKTLAKLARTVWLVDATPANSQV